jgi:hypothetical protein
LELAPTHLAKMEHLEGEPLQTRPFLPNRAQLASLKGPATSIPGSEP